MSRGLCEKKSQTMRSDYFLKCEIMRFDNMIIIYYMQLKRAEKHVLIHNISIQNTEVSLTSRVMNNY